MSCSPKLPRRVYIGDHIGSTIRLRKGDIRSLDYGSYGIQAFFLSLRSSVTIKNTPRP